MEKENFQDIKEAIEKEIAKGNELSIYKVTEELNNYKYDETGIYIPFNHENIYLKASRTESKKSEVIYTWTKYINNRFNVYLNFIRFSIGYNTAITMTFF